MAQMRTTLHSGATRYEKAVQFSGTDLTDPKFQVPEGMALDSENYVWDGNAVHKRHGLIDMSYLLDFEPTEEKLHYADESNYLNKVAVKKDAPVYDIWTIGSTYVIHKGPFLYVVPCAFPFSIPKNHCAPVFSGYTSEDGQAYYVVKPLPSRKLSAFVGGGKLWILTGAGFYRLGKNESGDWKLVKVSESPDVFVPKTTTGITENDSGIGQRATYEAVNMLTPWRTNGIASGVTNTENENIVKKHVYVLDGVVSDTDGVQVTIEECGRK